MNKVLLTKQAGKEFASLPQDIQKRIVLAINELETLGNKASNIKKLKTPFPGFRKRVGNYRILFETNKEIIIIYRITKRAEAYCR
jgi:mRNA-degrading endonuclease RelE of RelBE toxin-antitoxin system